MTRHRSTPNLSTSMTRLLAPLALALGLLTAAPMAEAQYLRATPTFRVSPLSASRVNRRAVAPRVTPTLANRARVYRARPSATVVTPRPATPAPAQPGTAQCAVTDNGRRALGATVTVRSGRSVVAVSDCSSSLELPAGSYVATVTLTSALDRPTRTVPFHVPAGGQARIATNFSTALLEVRFTDRGAPVHGRAAILRNGVEVGSLGSNVVGRVSAGTYTVQATYLGSQRTYSVSVSPNQRRAIRARF